MVLRARRRNTDTHASASLEAQAVLHDVRERIRAHRIIGGRVLQPLGAQHHAALGRRLINTHQRHRITVGINTRQRHGDTRHLARHSPRTQSLRRRRTVGRRRGNNLEGHRRCRLIPHRIDDRVRRAQYPCLVPGLDAHLVTGHEHRAQIAARQNRHRRIHTQRQTNRRTVVGQHTHRADIPGTYLRTVRRGLRRHILTLRIRRNNAHQRRRRPRAIGHRIRKRRHIGQAARCRNAQQVTLNQRHLQTRLFGHINRLHDQHTTRRIRIIRQRRDQRRAAAGQHRQIIFRDRHRRRIIRHHIHADHTHRRRRTIRHRVRELERTRHRSRKHQGAS